MRAATIAQTGDPTVLQEGSHPDPIPEKNQVLVRLKMAGVNHLDLWVRQGSPAYSVSLPHVTGSDGAGIVEAMGSEAEGVSVGDRVVILPGLFCGKCEYCLKGQDNQCDSFSILGAKYPGTYAEFVSVPDSNVAVIPDSVPFEEAAAFPLAGLTAWHMLLGRAQLKPKETVLVIGAGGGVGTFAIQIAKRKGARVLAVTSKPGKATKIKSLGADDVFVSQVKNDFVDWARQHTRGRGVEVVFENVGPATWEGSLAALAKCGRLVTCGATTGPSVPLELRALFSRDISILGARMGTQKEFQELSEAVFAGKIKPLIDKVFPLKEAAKAHAYLESGDHIGKVLLSMSS